MAKRYVKGSAKEHIFDNGGSNIHIDILKSDFDTLPVNERGYVKLTISKLKEVDQYGNSHTITLNDWKPLAKGATGYPAKGFTAQASPKAPLKAKEKDDLPF